MTTTLSRALFIAIAAAVLSLTLAPVMSHAAVEKTDGFVCPVITTDAVLNSPKGGALGDTGDYTIGGPDVNVPVHATNGDGTGVPAGDHASPGDTDYSAIWAS
ncbi:MAG TPA: hypothetical protein VJG64_02020 [Candidatus Paceibacterota bacterium]